MTNQLSIQQKAELAEYRNSVGHLPTKERAALVAEKRRELEGEGDHSTANKLDAALERVAPESPAVDVPVELPPVKRPRVIPHGALTWVECDLPGWEGVSVGYDLQARWDALNGPIKDDDGLGQMRRLMVLAPGFRDLPEDPLTGQPVAEPQYGVLESYAPLLVRCLPLAVWTVGDGYRKALEQSVKNS